MKIFLNILCLAALALLGYALGRLRTPTAAPAVWSPPPHSTKALDAPVTPVERESRQDDRIVTAADLALTDIAAALRQLGPTAPVEVLKRFFIQWAEKDPAAACEFFKSFGIPDQNAQVIGESLLWIWSGIDPAAGAAFALAEIDAPETLFRIDHLEIALAAHDPANAFQLGLTRIMGLEHVFAAWAKKDFAAASAALTQIPPGVRQEQAAKALLDQAMETDPTAALAWFREQPDSVRAEVGMFGLLNKYESAPPEIYFTMLGEQLINFGHTDDTSVALRAARKPDPDGKAIVDLKKSLDGHIGERLSKWAASDSSGSLKWAQEFPDPTLRPVLIGQWAQSMLELGNKEAAESALQDLPAPLQKEILHKSTAVTP